MTINKKLETLKKRGRPAGAKVLVLSDKDNRSEASNFVETLKEWDRMEDESNKTDWELIARKQEDRLNAYIAENEELAKICITRWEEIQHLKYLVSYLEGKNEDTSV
jgi:uncharacterized protein with WD repeat